MSMDVKNLRSSSSTTYGSFFSSSLQGHWTQPFPSTARNWVSFFLHYNNNEMCTLSVVGCCNSENYHCNSLFYLKNSLFISSDNIFLQASDNIRAFLFHIIWAYQWYPHMGPVYNFIHTFEISFSLHLLDFWWAMGLKLYLPKRILIMNSKRKVEVQILLHRLWHEINSLLD
jgi:hypothetical protein